MGGRQKTTLFMGIASSESEKKAESRRSKGKGSSKGRKKR